MGKDNMERDWDLRAHHDAVGYIASKHRGAEFFEAGTRQAYSLCSSFFEREDFTTDGKRMLDIGCGIGRLDRGFSQMFGEAWGLDVSGEMISQAIELNEGFKNIKFVKGSGRDLEVFNNEFFDFVFSYITFQHIPEKEITLNYLSEIHRVLKPGGLFKVLIRKEWAGFALLFGFIPVPRIIFRYIPEAIWTVYDHLAFRGDKVWQRGRTYRGSGISEKETVKALNKLGFQKIEIEEDPCKVCYWCFGRK